MAANRNLRIIKIVALVVLAHLGVLALIATRQTDPLPRAVESPVMVAELLPLHSAPAHAARATAESFPLPPPVPLPPVIRRHVVKPVQVRRLPRAAGVSDTGASTAPGPLASAQLTAAALAEPTGAPAAAITGTLTPVPGTPAAQPSITLSGPTSVRHIGCSIVRPEYPRRARRRGETGTVLIQIVVDAHGKVVSATIKKSSGSGQLDDAARSAALQSPCTPYAEGGQPVRAMTDIPFRFALDD